jgi:dTDP-4-dehydrorhamnose reductase
MVRVLVTGAEGMLGYELVRCLARAGYDAGGGGRQVIDVLDRRECDKAVKRFGADVVIDCSLPHGSTGQPGPVAVAARNVAHAAARVGALSVFVSCAAVFDGSSERPYVESDPPVPDTPIGEAKLAGERSVAEANARHAIVRTTWLFGAGGGNLVEAALGAGEVADRVPVDASTTSAPTFTAHLARALLTLLRRPAYGIFHVSAQGSCTEFQVARTALRLVGCPAQAVPLLVEAELPSKSERRLVLATRRDEIPSLPDWRLGLREYLEARTLTSVGSGPQLVAPEDEGQGANGADVNGPAQDL